MQHPLPPNSAFEYGTYLYLVYGVLSEALAARDQCRFSSRSFVVCPTALAVSFRGHRPSHPLHTRHPERIEGSTQVFTLRTVQIEREGVSLDDGCRRFGVADAANRADQRVV